MNLDEDMLQDFSKEELILHFKMLQKRNGKLELMLREEKAKNEELKGKIHVEESGSNTEQHHPTNREFLDLQQNYRTVCSELEVAKKQSAVVQKTSVIEAQKLSDAYSKLADMDLQAMQDRHRLSTLTTKLQEMKAVREKYRAIYPDDEE